MQAAILDAGAVAVGEKPDPEPGAGEILVQVRAAGVNQADLLQRAGRYPPPPGAPPDIPGLELAGEVVALGPGAARFPIGARVMAVVGGGAQAERAVLHERLAMAVPATLGWDEAGGLPEAFTTAHDALFTQCGLAMGERLLVTGAAGGVGTAAVQLGVGAGAQVTAAVRHPGRRDEVGALGAIAVDLGAAGAHGPFDVILELVGGAGVATALALLATGGRLAVIGISAGARAEIDLRRLMDRRAHIVGSTLRARPLEAKAAAARLVEAHVLPLFEGPSRRLRVPVAAAYPLADVAAAYERFAGGAKFGKIVLMP